MCGRVGRMSMGPGIDAEIEYSKVGALLAIEKGETAKTAKTCSSALRHAVPHRTLNVRLSVASSS